MPISSTVLKFYMFRIILPPLAIHIEVRDSCSCFPFLPLFLFTLSLELNYCVWGSLKRVLSHVRLFLLNKWDTTDIEGHNSLTEVCVPWILCFTLHSLFLYLPPLTSSPPPLVQSCHSSLSHSCGSLCAL